MLKNSVDKTLPQSKEVNCFSSLDKLSVSPELFREDLQNVLSSNYSVNNLLDTLSRHPRLRELFNSDSGVREQYTIREHTEMVLNQFDKYLQHIPLPGGISKNEIRLLLALHDIGKPIPGDVKEQHKYTIETIESVIEFLPLSERAWEVGREFLNQDFLGQCIRQFITKSASLEERDAIREKASQRLLTAEELKEFEDLVQIHYTDINKNESLLSAIKTAAGGMVSIGGRLGLTGFQALQIARIFYQADTAAYNYDAVTCSGRRAAPGLDFLYVRDRNSKDGIGLKSCEWTKDIDFSSGFINFFNSLREEIWATQAGLHGNEQPLVPFNKNELEYIFEKPRAAESQRDEKLKEIETKVSKYKDLQMKALEPFNIDFKAAISEAREITEGRLSMIANAAWNGEYGQGVPVLLYRPGQYTDGKIDQRQNRALNSVLTHDQFIYTRIVPVADLSRRGRRVAYNGCVEIAIGRTYNNDTLHFIAPKKSIIREYVPDTTNLWGVGLPDVAAVNSTEITPPELGQLMRSCLHDVRSPGLFQWGEAFGRDAVEAAMEIGDRFIFTEDLARDNMYISIVRLPNRYAILVPLVAGTHIDYSSEYHDVVNDYRWWALGAVDSPWGPVSERLVIGKGATQIVDSQISELTLEERDFLKHSFNILEEFPTMNKRVEYSRGNFINEYERKSSIITDQDKFL